MRHHDFYAGKAVKDSLVDDRRHHLGLLDRLADRIPQAEILEPEILDAFRMDEHRDAASCGRVPEWMKARMTEIFAAIARRQVRDFQLQLADGALHFAQRELHVLQRQDKTADEAFGMSGAPGDGAVV